MTHPYSGAQVDVHESQVDRFKAEHEVATTPLVFIDDQPVGGSADLERYLAEA